MTLIWLVLYSVAITAVGGILQVGRATGPWGRQFPPIAIEDEATADPEPFNDNVLALCPSCHVWTAPAMQEESDVSANVGCGHVFGLLLQPLWPLAMM